MSHILEDFLPDHKYIKSRKALEILKNGGEIDDEMVVELVMNRT